MECIRGRGEEKTFTGVQLIRNALLGDGWKNLQPHPHIFKWNNPAWDDSLATQILALLQSSSVTLTWKWHLLCWKTLLFNYYLYYNSCLTRNTYIHKHLLFTIVSVLIRFLNVIILSLMDWSQLTSEERGGGGGTVSIWHLPCLDYLYIKYTSPVTFSCPLKINICTFRQIFLFILPHTVIRPWL